jgi:hypothetical protein
MMKDSVRAVAVVLTFAAAASAQVPAGGEFLVNAYTTGAQRAVRSAMEPDGDFVLVWESSGGDGSSYGTFGQRFAASGAPRGGEFQINTYTTEAQFRPAVAAGGGGDFVVVWMSFQDGSGTSVHGQRLDAAGPVGAEFRVNTFTPADQDRADVGRAADGRFVVTWMTSDVEGVSGGIAARRFDASGDPVGSEFVVNTYTTGSQASAAVAVEANGNFVAVWEDSDNHRDGSGAAVFGQRFDASGIRLGGEFQVNTTTAGNQRLPSVSVSPVGGFVVAWSSASGDGSGYAAFSRRFDAAGNAVGNDFLVNSYTTGNQLGFAGRVAHDALGNFVITWGGLGDGSFDASFGQRFDSAGLRRGAEFRVNTYTTGQQGFPVVASDAVGNFVVAWNSQGRDGSSYGIGAQRFGGLRPVALEVDRLGNHVLEPGETVDVAPAWANSSGAPQAVGGVLSDMAGPPGAIYTITDANASYETIADQASAACVECYLLSVSSPALRPRLHWDASVVETLTPDAQGQAIRRPLHVGASFTDVSTAGVFYPFIETLLHHGVTSGCSPNQYCPASSTTRAQIAAFVLLAKERPGYVPPACTTPMFLDVPASSPFCPWIEELARRGVVGGCGGGNYCPSTVVTRREMAVFALRTLDPGLSLPACTASRYDDVPASSGFCPWIEELSRRGVVAGCGGGNYCPGAAVTRAQMGVFISATFGLTLYGP